MDMFSFIFWFFLIFILFYFLWLFWLLRKKKSKNIENFQKDKIILFYVQFYFFLRITWIIIPLS